MAVFSTIVFVVFKSIITLLIVAISFAVGAVIGGVIPWFIAYFLNKEYEEEETFFHWVNGNNLRKPTAIVGSIFLLLIPGLIGLCAVLGQGRELVLNLWHTDAKKPTVLKEVSSIRPVKIVSTSSGGYVTILDIKENRQYGPFQTATENVCPHYGKVAAGQTVNAVVTEKKWSDGDDTITFNNLYSIVCQ